MYMYKEVFHLFTAWSKCCCGFLGKQCQCIQYISDSSFSIKSPKSFNLSQHSFAKSHKWTI